MLAHKKIYDFLSNLRIHILENLKKRKRARGFHPPGIKNFKKEGGREEVGFVLYCGDFIHLY